MSIVELERKIIQASDAYYNTSEPIMSDQEFDSLIDKLKQLDPNNRILTLPNWGSTLKTHHLTEYNHQFFVTGLPKFKSVDIDLNSLTDHLITAKLDGISAVAYYDNGSLKYVLTRNNGQTGFDITHNLVYCNIPKTVNSSISWVRGEIVAPIGSAKRNGYANERNMVAGLANSLEVGIYHADLEFIAYDCNLGKTVHTLSELNLNGFYTARNFQLSKEYPYRKIEHSFDYTAYNIDYPYLTDGIVITDNEGNSYAVKYPNKVYVANVIQVINQISNRGRIIPVIQIEPIEINGTTIQYCSGFNYESIKNAQIGEGAIIEITKANEVIPHWVNTLKSGKYIEPDEIEGQPTKWNGVHLEVKVDKVRNSIVKLIEQKVPKGFANAKIKLLIDNYNITDFSSLAKILTNEFDTNNKDRLKADFGAFYNYYLEFIDNARKGWTLSELLIASFTEGLGEIASNMIQEQYDSSREMLITDLMTVNGLPDTINVPTVTVRNGIKNNLELLISLLSSNLPSRIEEKITKDNLIPICITGKLSKPRSALLDEWKSIACEVDISKADFLITDDPNSESSKNKKAKKLGIKIITEAEFRGLYVK